MSEGKDRVMVRERLENKESGEVKGWMMTEGGRLREGEAGVVILS